MQAVGRRRHAPERASQELSPWPCSLSLAVRRGLRPDRLLPMGFCCRSHNCLVCMAMSCRNKASLSSRSSRNPSRPMAGVHVSTRLALRRLHRPPDSALHTRRATPVCSCTLAISRTFRPPRCQPDDEYPGEREARPHPALLAHRRSPQNPCIRILIGCKP